uniref:glycoside hydrolase family 88 protein n=1 Tax=Prevotella sp. TaxID=59823 RepID=UPI003FEE1CF7
MRYLKQLNKHKNNKTKSEMKHKTLTFRFLDMSRGGFARLFLLLLLPCLSVIGVKAADSNGGVKVTFNPAVRYSQWAINSRLYDFRGNQKAYGFKKWNSNTESLGEYANKANMKLDYVAGLVGKATLETSDYYVDFDWAKPWFKSAQAYANDYNYSAQNQDKMTLDNMNAAKMAFHIINNSKWGEDAAKKAANNAIEAIITDLRYYNENYVIGGTKSNVKEATANDVQKKMLGGWFHKYNYVDQVWCDGMYMGPALLAQLINYKNATNNVSNDDWSLLTKQFSITWEQLRDSKTGLLYHGMTATPTITDWSKDTTPTSYHSGAFWGRANAWYMLALVDVLELMPTSNTNYSTLKGYLEKLAESIASYQNADGTWYQVLDQKDNALEGNYEESSCSALFTAAYLKALRLKLLESSKYETMAKNAYVALVNKFMAYDKNDNNKIQILGSCCSAGLGTNSNSLRDGSRSYYITGNDSKAVTGENTGYYYTEGKVLGGFIMAATEYERAYQNQDSKQILFARDLAPIYNFSTTPGTLDATAYGDGTVSYQWYKDEKAIADATSATYTPTVSGKYYCIATANGKSADDNHIQTSTTTVTAKSNSNTDNGSTDNNGGSENGTTTGNIFSYTIKTSEAATNTSYTATGGTVTLGAANNVYAENGYKLGSDFNKSGYIKITLSGTKLQEGDVIKISAYSSAKGKGGLVAYTGTTTGSSSVSLGNMTQKSEDISYTVKASDILNGLSTFYIYRKTGESTYIKSISITRAVKKYTVSATAGKGGSVSIKNGSSEVTSGTEVEENTSLTFTATPNDGYEFVNWTDASNKVVSTNATYTTTVSAEISLTANFKAKTTVDPTESGVIYDFTGSIGTTTDGTSCTTANKVITFNSNFSATDGKYITIKSKTGGFKAGDMITLKGYCDSPNLSGVIIYSDVNVNSSSIFKSNVLAKKAAGGSEFTYTIEKDCDALYLGRYGGGTTRLTSLKVERPASSSDKTRLTASFEHDTDVVVNTTTTVPLPTLTVNAGENILAADQYTVDYKSNAEDVATVSGHTITIKSLGIATITATVTPTDANTYEGTTATYQLSVKAPSPLNVSVMDVTINTTDTEEEQPVIKVYGDNDKLLKLGQDYTLSFEVSGDKNVTVDNTTGKFSVTKNAGKFIKGTSLITVTATPRASLGSNYTVGTLQFSYSVSEGKIKPVFSDSFKDITINLQPGKSKTIAVPLIYNGEDVSSYFTYIYTIDPAISGLTVDGSKLTFTTPSATRTYTVKVNADAATIGDVNYGDVYDKPAEISFTLNVDSKYKTISVTPDPTSIKMDAGTTHDAPDLTVKNETTTLGDTEYKVTWFSTSPGVVKVDATTGKIEAVSEGTANIRVVVTGDNLESTTALITVEVDDPAMYRVKSGETYVNHTTMWNQDRTMSVVLGGWLFSDDVKKIVETPNTSKEGLSAGYYWGPGATKAKWKLTGFDYYVAGDNNRNARQENGSNALPETTNIYSADFVKYQGTIKDKMFNVPCSGSYLEFNPVTNGKVTAHIFQNGVFDAKTEKDNTKTYQYRPQRRVFVMDEAGNFVESTAHIESTNGKPTGGIQKIGKYTWDLDSKTLTIGDVRSHFKGIPDTFDMTAEAFKNNVYESLLDTKKVPNAAANDRKGSHGWSVLADSPVTYTFNVKAGKTYYLYNFGSKIGFYGFSFDEDETKPTVVQVNYDAETANANNVVEKTAEGNVAQVKIARKMVANRWTTCVLPFSLNRQQVDAIFGPAYSATAKEGTQILYFDHVEGNKAYFVRHAYNTIVAGKPFLIKPTKEVTSINTADVKDYPYVTIENTEPAKWCESNGYVWTSSYNTMNIVKNDYFIGASDGKFKAYSGTSGTVKGFRGFLKADHSAGTKPMMLSISTSSITDGNEGETTGIEDLIINADGELIPANCRVYNINGQLVSEDANSFQSLPSGIYIINGKKYIK